SLSPPAATARQRGESDGERVGVRGQRIEVHCWLVSHFISAGTENGVHRPYCQQFRNLEEPETFNYNLQPARSPVNASRYSQRLTPPESGCGVSYHLRAPFQDGSHYFQNDYRGFSGGTTNLIPDPLALPFHFQP